MFLFFPPYSTTLNTDENCKTKQKKRLHSRLSTRNYMNLFFVWYSKKINDHAGVKRVCAQMKFNILL